MCGDDNDAGSTPRNLLSHKSSNINNSTSTCTMRAALRTVTADEERAQAQHPTQVHAAKSTTKNHEDMNTNSGNDKHADRKDSSSTTSSRTPPPLTPPRTGSGASTLRLHEERAAHEQHAAARLHASDLRPPSPSAIQTAAGNAEASAGPRMHYNTEHQVSASLETAARAPQILDIKLTCGEGTGRARDEELSVTINLAACAWKTAGLIGKQQPPISQPDSQTVRQSGVPESHPHGHRHKYITHTTRDTWTSLPLQALVSHFPHPAPCHRLLPRVPPPVFEPTVFDVARAQAAAGCTPSTRGGGYWLPIRPPPPPLPCLYPQDAPTKTDFYCRERDRRRFTQREFELRADAYDTARKEHWRYQREREATVAGVLPTILLGLDIAGNTTANVPWCIPFEQSATNGMSVPARVPR